MDRRANGREDGIAGASEWIERAQSVAVHSGLEEAAVFWTTEEYLYFITRFKFKIQGAVKLKKEPNVESHNLAFLMKLAKSRRDSLGCSLSRATAAARRPTRIKTSLPSQHRRRGRRQRNGVANYRSIRFQQRDWGGRRGDGTIA